MENAAFAAVSLMAIASRWKCLRKTLEKSRRTFGNNFCCFVSMFEVTEWQMHCVRTATSSTVPFDPQLICFSIFTWSTPNCQLWCPNVEHSLRASNYEILHITLPLINTSIFGFNFHVGTLTCWVLSVWRAHKTLTRRKPNSIAAITITKLCLLCYDTYLTLTLFTSRRQCDGVHFSDKALWKCGMDAFVSIVVEVVFTSLMCWDCYLE